MTIENLPVTKKTDQFIRNVTAEEIFKYFYISVEQYQHYQYFENRIIDGEEVPYSHTIFEMHSPKNNRFELKGVIAEERRQPGGVRHTRLYTALMVEVLQLDTSAFVTVKYSPFFESIVKDLLSKFETEDQISMKKNKGRKELTGDVIKFRRKMVKEAEAYKKKNPNLRQGEIDQKFADDLDIAADSFRHWRGNNY